ncbi:polyprotein [Melon mild mottle virus]|uniref:RNA1 polyprotein n=1 Tax=Melon mild mottle virus TaxID=669377 RepID=E0D3E7_9SECO|nr:polyprotein [Melon mild mottle virus]BAJ16223.1 polyprotein [Melon mild mottle virus]
MAWACQAKACLKFGLPVSNAEARELRYVCDAVMCGASLMKRSQIGGLAIPQVVPVVGPIRPQEASLAKKLTVSGPVRPNGDSAPIQKQKADVVVSLGEPLLMEFVYPPLVKEAISSQEEVPAMLLASGCKAMAPFGAVDAKVVESAPLPAWAAPAWLRAMPKQCTPAVRPKTLFPKRAVAFNGINFIDARGRIVLSDGARKILKGVRALEKRQRKAAAIARRVERKKRAAMKAAAAQKKQQILWAQMQRAQAKAILKALESEVQLSSAQESLVREEIRAMRMASETMACKVRAFKAHRAALVAERAAKAAEVQLLEQEGCIEDDWEMVPKTLPVRRVVAKASPLEKAISHVERMWYSAEYSSVLKERMQTEWDSYPFKRLAVGRLCSAFLVAAKFTVPEVLEENLLMIDDLTVANLNEISEGLEEEAQHFGPNEFEARAGIVNWIKETAVSLAKLPKNLFCSAKEKIEDMVISTMQSVFEKTMTPFLGHLTSCAELFRTFWDKCKAWIQKIRENLSDALLALQEHALWALVVMMAGGIVVLAETILMKLGVLERVGNVLGLFLTLFLTSLGFSAISLGADKFIALNNSFKMAVCTMLKPPELDSIVPGDVQNEFEARSLVGGLDVAISALSTVGRSLCSLKFGTLMYWGKIGSAFDQLWRGKKAVEELGSWLVEIIGNIADTLTGRHIEFFDELAATVGGDPKLWLKRAHDVKLQCQTMDLSGRMVLETVENLLAEGQNLLVGISGVPRRTSTDFGMIIKKQVEELIELRSRCAKAGKFEGTRVFPFWVYVFGASQSGKTNFANSMVAPELLAEMNLPRDSIFTKGKSDAFWSGYCRQSCIMIDDMFAVKVEPSIESQMIDVVNSQAFPLNMAYIEDKGMLMDSPIVVTTCNEEKLPSDSGVRDEPSFYNRRGVVVECRRVEGSKYNPGNLEACAEVRLLQPKHQAKATDPARGAPLTDWMTPSEAMAVIKTKMGEHMGDEMIRINTFRSQRGIRHPIFEFAKDFLKDLDLIGHPLSESEIEECNIRMKEGGERPRGFSFLALDRQLFVYNALHRLVECTFDKMPLHLEGITLDNVYNDIHVRLARDPKNGFVGSFLHEMVNLQHNIISVDKMTTKCSAEQQTFFHSLPLTERVYLRLSQLKIDTIHREAGASPGEFAYQKLMRAMKKTYAAVADNGRSIFLLLAAVVCIVISFYGLFSILASCFGGASVASAAIAMNKVDAMNGLNSSSASGPSVRRPNRYMPVQQRTVLARSMEGEEVPEWHSLIVEIHSGHASQFISACQYFGRSLLMTRHQALDLKRGQEVVIAYDKSYPLYHVWNPDNIVEFDDSELVVYTSGDLQVLSNARKKRFFLEDFEADLPSKFRAHCAGVRLASDGTPKTNEWKSDASVLTEKATIVRYQGKQCVYQRQIPKYVVYPFEAKDHDCGALCMAFVNKQWKVTSLLVGYADGRTTCSLLPAWQPMEAKSVLSYNEEIVEIAPGYCKVGWLPVDQTPHLPKKSQFVEVPLKYQPKNVEVKHPAILSKDDERLPKILADLEKKEGLPKGSMSYDPLINGLEKFAEPMEAVDEGLLRHVADEIVEEWFDCLEGSLSDVSLDVAINGADGEAEKFFDPLVMSTSEGYPFTLTRTGGETGKARFFEGLPGERTLLPNTPVEIAYRELCEYEGIPELVCVECPKDECLVERKILKPKTRLFSILPLHYNLRLRQKFLSFSAFLMRNRHRLPCQVGINVYSREWLDIYTRLAQVNDVACNCDYQSFDGLMTYQFLNVIGDMINRCYRDDSEKSLSQRKNLLLALYQRKSIAGNQVYSLRAGIPSGCALTVLLNSLFNELLVRIAYRSLVPGVNRDRFSKCVCLLVYGDDNLIACSQSVIKDFNGNALKDWLAQYKVTITDGKDKTAPTIEERPLLELDFLKRGFKLAVGGRVLAPLDKKSIYSSLVHVRAKDLDWVPLLFDNYQNCLRELVMHDDREEFEALRKYYETLFPSWKGSSLTWNEVQSWHTAQLTGNSGLSYNDRMDVLINPQFSTFMQQHGPADVINSVDNNFSIAGPKWCDRGGDYFVVSTFPLFRGEVGIHVPIVPGGGIGCMPTNNWVRNWASGSCEYSQKISEAISDKKHVVFRDNQPYIGAWTALISFCSGFGFRTVEESMILYRNICPKDPIHLSTFFSWCNKRTPAGHLSYTGPALVSVEEPFVKYLQDEFRLVPFDEVVYPHICVTTELVKGGRKHYAFKDNALVSGRASFAATAKLKCSSMCAGHEAMGIVLVDIGVGNKWEDRFLYDDCSFEAACRRSRLPHYAAINKVRAMTCLGKWCGNVTIN